MFRNEIKVHSTEYNDQDWQNAIDKYADICERLDEMNLTKDEKLEIDKLKGEVAGYAATSASQQMFDAVESISKEVAAFADGFENTYTQPKNK